MSTRRTTTGWPVGIPTGTVIAGFSATSKGLGFAIRSRAWAYYSALLFFFSSRRRHTRCSRDWSSDVCSSDLQLPRIGVGDRVVRAHPAPGGDLAGAVHEHPLPLAFEHQVPGVAAVALVDPVQIGRAHV